MHRNLSTRTRMFALVLQIFLGKEHLEKNWLISTLDKAIEYKGTIFQGAYKTSLHFTKKGGDQLKKILPFFKHASFSVAPRISMLSCAVTGMKCHSPHQQYVHVPRYVHTCVLLHMLCGSTPFCRSRKCRKKKCRN
jgi:hypothetical protein